MLEVTGLIRRTRIWCRRQEREGRADQVMRLAVAAVVLLFPAACLLVDRSDSVSLLLLTLIGSIVWARRGFKAELSRREWLYVACFAAFFLATVLAFEFGHQSDAGFRLLGRYFRLLLVFPVYVALKRYRPPALLVWAGLGLGALALGVDALWEKIGTHGFLRPDGDTNVAILFGDLAALTTFTFAAGYVYIDARLPNLGPLLVTLGVVAGLSACLLSGTRGAWVAMPVMFVLLLSFRHLLQPRTVLISILTVLLLFALAWWLPQTQVRARFDSAVSELHTAVLAISSFRDDTKPPLCLDDPTLLQAWADMNQHSVNRDDAQPHVWRMTHRDFNFLEGFGCRLPIALIIHNGADRAAWVELGHMHSLTHVAHAQLLAEGRGVIKFGLGPRSRVHAVTKRFRRYDLYTTSAHSDNLDIIVPRSSDLEFIPIELQPGEYRYAMLASSVGQRLEMWAVAMRLFAQAPFTGAGTGAYQSEAQKLVDAGTAPADSAEYDHPHSDYFDALASRGLVGLLALLALLGLPAWLFSRGLDDPDAARLVASLAGLLTTVGFALCGLTETLFIHSVTIGWYVIMTAVLMAQAEAPRGREKSRG